MNATTRSTWSSSPSSTASTAPSPRLRTQPLTFASCACWRAVSRKKTPCTSPWTMTRRLTMAPYCPVSRASVVVGRLSERELGVDLGEQLAHAAREVVDDRARLLDAAGRVGQLLLDRAALLGRLRRALDRLGELAGVERAPPAARHEDAGAREPQPELEREHGRVVGGVEAHDQLVAVVL